MMLLVISDASVLIDIECGDLTYEMFRLPWEFAVPDVLFDEELAEHHYHLLKFGLKSKTMSGELVNEAYRMRQHYVKVSINDLLALTLAKHEKCQLLTGDKALRKIAKNSSIEVHGTIWLVKQMLRGETVTVETAKLAFLRMRDAGSRLPWGEVERMLDELSSLVIDYA